MEGRDWVERGVRKKDWIKSPISVREVEVGVRWSGVAESLRLIRVKDEKEISNM